MTHENQTERIAIRPATLADDAHLTTLVMRLSAFDLPLWRQPSDIAAADMRDMLAAIREGSSANQVWVAERAGEVVGCLHVLLTTDFFGTRHAHLSVIATTSAAEGTGVGQALLAHAEQWARDHGQALLTLNVFAANDRARRFYERAAFAPEMVKYVKRLA